jgi:hypothetical protein
MISILPYELYPKGNDSPCPPKQPWPKGKWGSERVLRQHR